MRELVFEILLRLLKPLAATIFGGIVWVVVVGILGAEATAETFLLCWLTGATFMLLTQEGPI